MMVKNLDVTVVITIPRNKSQVKKLLKNMKLVLDLDVESGKVSTWSLP